MDDDMPTRVRLLRIAGLALTLALIAGCAADARPPVRASPPPNLRPAPAARAFGGPAASALGGLHPRASTS
ncbi:hypothetical protein, partial [Salmonella enterica]|uniref:hypothetical protein n=1 Tax=Salmonella enterica TaxID=28901 RepID=UPI0022B67BB1|nr:hypothetical protein [Salmonella enterica]